MIDIILQKVGKVNLYIYQIFTSIWSVLSNCVAMSLSLSLPLSLINVFSYFCLVACIEPLFFGVGSMKSL